MTTVWCTATDIHDSFRSDSPSSVPAVAFSFLPFEAQIFVFFGGVNISGITQWI